MEVNEKKPLSVPIGYVRNNYGEILRTRGMELLNNYGQAEENVRYGVSLTQLLQVGDFVRIEYFESGHCWKKANELFRVEAIDSEHSLISLLNEHTSFTLVNDVFYETKCSPRIKSVITRENSECEEFVIDNEASHSR